jgi:sulfate adenylyltransferase (ADP) / ATP adenylyltransferase
MTEVDRTLSTINSGTLWQRIQEQTHYALQCSALQPLLTEYEFIEDHGIQFLVRILSNLDRKEQAQRREVQANNSKKFNPFLPYDPNLFVTDISETHVCLLNKFNVIAHHFLVITRAFEEQESLLTLQDFLAAWVCLTEVNSFVFYNAGKAAGASQRHKHLQFLPLPLIAESPDLPIESTISAATFRNEIGQISCFPFQHALIRFNFKGHQNILKRALYSLECYQKLLTTVNISTLSNQEERNNISAYNLLMTNEWMLIIPRLQESSSNISVNAAGFAGTLFVRSMEQMQLLKAKSPIAILRGVTLPQKES